MPDTPITREALVALQRQFNVAHTRTLTASRAHPGPTADWPAEALTELRAARQAEIDLAVALDKARTGTEWAPWSEQQKIREAAGEG